MLGVATLEARCGGVRRPADAVPPWIVPRVIPKAMVDHFAPGVIASVPHHARVATFGAPRLGLYIVAVQLDYHCR